MGQIQFKETRVDEEGFFRPVRMCVEQGTSTCFDAAARDLSAENAKIMAAQYYRVNGPCRLETLSMTFPLGEDSGKWYIARQKDGRDLTMDELKDIVYAGSKTMGEWRVQPGFSERDAPEAPASFTASVTPCPAGTAWCAQSSATPMQKNLALVLLVIVVVLIVRALRSRTDR